jgi:hypothetical protein
MAQFDKIFQEVLQEGILGGSNSLGHWGPWKGEDWREDLDKPVAQPGDFLLRIGVDMDADGDPVDPDERYMPDDGSRHCKTWRLIS